MIYFKYIAYSLHPFFIKLEYETSYSYIIFNHKPNTILIHIFMIQLLVTYSYIKKIKTQNKHTPMPGPGFPMSYIGIYGIFCCIGVQLRWVVIVCFIDIGGTDDHHWLSFLSITYNTCVWHNRNCSYNLCC
jgi:hypothetical protein